MTTQPTTTTSPTVAEQAPVLLSQLAGYIGHRTIAIGLRAGLIDALARQPAGATADELAEQLGLDPFYVSVWCRSAFSAGVCDRNGRGYRLAPHMGTLLLDTTSPAYVGGVFNVLQQHEVFGRFEEHLASGERLWWDETSPEWIASVARTGTPFYVRLIPGGLDKVPGLPERLAAGGRVVDSACGTGAGVIRLAETYPASQVVGVDGDAHSVQLARQRVADAGLSDRVTLGVSPLEELQLETPATAIINNISMHECRDIDRVTKQVAAALEPGGWFVISDFPFPDSDEGLRTLPGRIMSGIQFFEAQIDDQLLPRSFYDDLLRNHGFTDLGSASLTPMHAITWGRRPR
jgi:ubiquinone/menaquinone biosynthesis C-methylase UbiE